ncbi:pyruvate ferredoxin oxidoreductase [Candidatus Poribacteria bacterium]|nr:pyruvate ferredoxin oxidoreductase [Candidatus Poribacteria bacterium]
MKKVIMGNHAVSHAVRLAKVEVISAYPITPQTQIVEELSYMCAEGKLRARFIKVESEHSAMAACIGASSGGSRVFTATTSHGLALMHELLHWASGARLPIVMAEPNRALSPWNIWADQTDALSQRDTGWLQLYCTSNQEILDSVLIAYRLAESLLLPVMVAYDAFVLSHTYEAVDIPEQETVNEFLPKYEPELKMDLDNPMAFGSFVTPEYYMEMKWQTEEAIERAHRLLPEIWADFNKIFGRGYSAVEGYRCQDAELILLTSGSISSSARVVIDKLRGGGKRVGLLNIRLFRPFPVQEIHSALRGCKKVAVLDRNISLGTGGIFAQELKAALYGKDGSPQVFGFVAGLGGRDITLETIEEVIAATDRLKTPARDIEWIGLKP